MQRACSRSEMATLKMLREDTVKRFERVVPAKVLLVDDDLRQLETCACILTMGGFPVLTARGPVEALSLATKLEEFDVAVIDYEMPVMNGAALAERLKSKLPKLCVVLYSAALSIPASDLETVDTVISKGEGITALLRQLWSLSAEYPSNSCPPHDAREPPASQTQNRRIAHDFTQ